MPDTERGRHAQTAISEQTAPWAVEARDLRFAYGDRHADVLHIPRLQVPWGQRLFISGPSGCGKSTLLSLLGGVFTPVAGSVSVAGTALHTLSGRQRDRFRADHLGFVFQLFNLVPYLSILDNVTLPCSFSPRRRARACQRSGHPEAEARRLLSHLELDGPVLERPATELSIGQQQRAALARALIGAPEIVIADEPTSALDEGTRERFVELLFAECAELASTLILVSHDARLAPLFDRQLPFSELSAA